MGAMKRLYDVHGDPISLPAEYYVASNAVRDMIDAADQQGVDRSDIARMLMQIQADVNFHYLFNTDQRKGE